MKQIILLLSFAFALLSARAGNENPVMISGGNFKHFAFGDNMKVVLIAAPQGQQMSMGEEISDKLQVSLYNGTMTIRSMKTSSDLVVYVLVNNPQSITLGENTVVETQGTLESSSLEVFVDRGSVARIRTTGTVKPKSVGDFDVLVEKIASERQPTREITAL